MSFWNRLEAVACLTHLLEAFDKQLKEYSEGNSE
jgi:hypothetical protein